MSPTFCSRCAIELHPGAGDSYQITIEAVADPAPPVLSSDASREGLRAEIDRLMDQLADVSEREALDQVHRRLVLHLCVPCYRQWIENPTP
ncbi:MAG: hypothetical protein L0Y71_16945 [Gemmataceae bacterium]|nr:hypothetical protein [Gemmataceae bacterium]